MKNEKKKQTEPEKGKATSQTVEDVASKTAVLFLNHVLFRLPLSHARARKHVTGARQRVPGSARTVNRAGMSLAGYRETEFLNETGSFREGKVQIKDDAEGGSRWLAGKMTSECKDVNIKPVVHYFEGGEEGWCGGGNIIKMSLLRRGSTTIHIVVVQSYGPDQECGTSARYEESDTKDLTSDEPPKCCTGKIRDTLTLPMGGGMS
ncbi:hypothetical protein ZHAS_00013117 [Anopheles sinensis]|uniref:Uncharacterized protein n=1 Tax=Anopheles sinensis TaxID=74873 RepID=A0A084W4L7_ANOSI|nr:hypothetical protein ZHAS_00013117 [Anopheles sinensis]